MSRKLDAEMLDRWNKKAEEVLLGKRIVKVRYMEDSEMAATGFYRRSLVIQLNDGTLLYPSADDEGNDAGALHYQKKGDDEWVLPVI